METIIIQLTSSLETTGNTSYFIIVWNIISIFSNLWFTVPIAVFILISLIVSIDFFRNKQPKLKIKYFIKNTKYIPDLFTEVDNTKEILRHFYYRKKYKKKIYREFNNLFNTYFGQRVKKAVEFKKMHFYNSSKYAIYQINSIKTKILELIDLKSNDKEFEFLITNNPVDKLDLLIENLRIEKTKAVMVLGTAGNGKTNLLCDFSNRCIENHNICLFINSSEVDIQLTEWCINLMFKGMLKKINIYIKIIIIYSWGLILFLMKKKCFIIIDALNENDSKQFLESLNPFVRLFFKIPAFNLLISCRLEYFEDRFSNYFTEEVNSQMIKIKIENFRYNKRSIKRLNSIYSDYFDFNGQITGLASSQIYKSLILMRLFYEVNSGSNAIIYNINKHEIFNNYINKSIVKDAKTKIEIYSSLYEIVKIMFKNLDFKSVLHSDLIEKGVQIDYILDETIVLTKSIIKNENTLAECDDIIYAFTFDEIRDYVIAKYLSVCVFNEACTNFHNEFVILMEQLNNGHKSPFEGVFTYLYLHYKNINKLEYLEEMIKYSLDKEIFNVNDFPRFSNLYLHTIFSEYDGALLNIENAYLKDHLVKIVNLSDFFCILLTLILHCISKNELDGYSKSLFDYIYSVANVVKIKSHFKDVYNKQLKQEISILLKYSISILNFESQNYEGILQMLKKASIISDNSEISNLRIFSLISSD